jgi:hypothetical protein
MQLLKSLRLFGFYYFYFVFSALFKSSKKSKANATNFATKKMSFLHFATPMRSWRYKPMQITAYEAAMLTMGNNVNALEIVANGVWTEDGEHLFRTIIFKDFAGNYFSIEEIRDEDGRLVRPWDPIVDAFPVRRIVNEENEIDFVDIDDEEPVQ